LIPSFKTQHFNDQTIDYDGTQLAPHWIYRELNLAGDAVVSFIGNADVGLDHMVDLEDVKKKAPIYSPQMLHFLAEFFIDSLDTGILLQHLLVSEVYELLCEAGHRPLRRRGNDIYFQDRKFSVSICTRSPVSVLIHIGLNIQTEGTPIPTSGLQELQIDPDTFAWAVLERFAADAAIWRAARSKVLPR
jgi:hypothetical protein